jgi:hypothetical protein
MPFFFFFFFLTNSSGFHWIFGITLAFSAYNSVILVYDPVILAFILFPRVKLLFIIQYLGFDPTQLGLRFCFSNLNKVLIPGQP